MEKFLLLLSLVTLFGNVAVAQQSNEDKKKQEQVNKEPDEGITGAFHQKNIGKILFATARIGRGGMNADMSQYKTTFNLGEPIYGRGFLERGINKYLVYGSDNYPQANEMQSNEGYVSEAYTIMYVDGKQILPYAIGQDTFVRDDNNNHITTYQVYVAKNAEDGGIGDNLRDAFNKLTPGKHQVKIESWAGDYSMKKSSKTPIATGEFTLVVAGNGGGMKLGRTFEALQAGMHNPVLEANILKAIQKKALAEGWKEKLTKVKISSDDWEIYQNDLTGVVVGRALQAWVFATWADGHCTYQDFEFRQNYAGNGFLESFWVSGVGDQQTCDCP